MLYFALEHCIGDNQECACVCVYVCVRVLPFLKHGFVGREKGDLISQ